MNSTVTPKSHASYSFFTRNRIFLLVILLIGAAATPMMITQSGLTSPVPVAAYLNGVFPDSPPTDEVEVAPAFPNLTFNSPLTWTMHPSRDTVFVGQRDGMIYWFEQDDATSTKILFWTFPVRLA